MKTTYINDLNYLIKCLHYRHGIGDIRQIQRFADGRVELVAQGYGMKPHTRRGRIISNPKPGSYTVKMYRHQITGIVVGASS